MSDPKQAPTLERRTYTIVEAAQILGISRTHMWALLKSGEIQSIALGRRRLIPKTAIDELFKLPAKNGKSDE